MQLYSVECKRLYTLTKIGIHNENELITTIHVIGHIKRSAIITTSNKKDQCMSGVLRFLLPGSRLTVK